MTPAPLRRAASWLLAVPLALGAGSAQAGDLEVLHYWYGNAEADAMVQLRAHMRAKGYAWKDLGADGASSQSALRDRMAARLPPVAAQVPTSAIRQWGPMGLLGQVDALARSERWDAVLPRAVSSLMKYNGNYVAAPLYVHRTNWLWMNADVFKRAGARPPTTWEQFFDAAEAIRRAGITPLAHGGQPWQNLHLFETVVLGTGGAVFYRNALLSLDPVALKSPAMVQALLTFRRIKRYTDPRAGVSDWIAASGEVVQGRAAMQVMGEWARTFYADAEKAGKLHYNCAAAPAARNDYLFALDSFVMLNVSGADKLQAQRDFASALLSPQVQQKLSLTRGAIPARLGVDLGAFDRCAKSSGAAYQAAAKADTLVATVGLGLPPKLVDAMVAVIDDFWRDERITPRSAIDRLVALQP